ncbi:gag-pol polyprotein [Lasius niger]|uniref:Gag-pol polyprotein n=1 Tax=Lasius niger TaxID=67767 RepID=A0A0J7KWU2_LASNI|nr:gag-pol polyprotein [Lasius niger]
MMLKGNKDSAEAGTDFPSLPRIETASSSKAVDAIIEAGWDLLEDHPSGPRQATNEGSSMERMNVEVVKSPALSATVTSVALDPEKEKQINGKQGDQIDEINVKIKDLVRRKRELRREAELGKSDAGSGGPSFSSERPLPQRVPKSKPRIVSNIQVVSPKTVIKKVGFPRQSTDGNRTDSSRQEWKVSSRKGKGGGRLRGKNIPPSPLPRRNRRETPEVMVMITGNKENFSYADALKKARGSISLDDLEIIKTKIRKAANGSLLIEVIGPGGAEKALKLKDKLIEVLKNEARVTRPVTKGEIRLIGLHDATSPEEVVNAVSGYGNCLLEDIKIGPIHPMRNGLFTVWVQCPLGAAVKTANYGRISVGWTQVRVDLLNNRPVQCFRCWRFGHMKHSCQSKKDFGGSCFRCGGEGHSARNCAAPPACKICRLDGRSFDHRLGSNLCPAANISARIRPISTNASGSSAGVAIKSNEDSGTAGKH